ncbi:MAG: hypothetical protein NVSMB70_01700 [Chamaesiphon sp.]
MTASTKSVRDMKAVLLRSMRMNGDPLVRQRQQKEGKAPEPWTSPQVPTSYEQQTQKVDD